MANYFNDSPIEDAADDQYGFSPFAKSLAKSIVSIKDPIGTTIALTGPWGSGKSSVVNLLRSELNELPDTDLIVTSFNCWWYRGEEALALAFLQHLHAVLKDSLGDKIKDLIPAIGRGLLQAGPVLGPVVAIATTGPWGALTSGATVFAKRFFGAAQTPEAAFRKLSKALDNEDRRFLVVIDDIDRLTPQEALAVFRLTKSVGRLPNVMYLLAFDRQLADAAVAALYPSEGPHFLEKIIQATFEIPTPLQSDLNRSILTAASEICGPDQPDQMVRFMNLFYDAVAPYIATPRHVARLRNTISVTWPAIDGEINRADFLALEAIRLYEPALYENIKAGKAKLCGTPQTGDPPQGDDSRFDDYLKNISADRHDSVKQILQRLFPRLEAVGHSTDFLAGWDTERRVCIEAHFDTYFRLSLSEDALSVRTIDQLVERADNIDFIQQAMRDASETPRSNGKTFVPVYLDELNTHASRVDRAKVENLVHALFEIHDEIDLPQDEEKGMQAGGGTSLRYHWLIRRLTKDRFTIDERSALFVKALRAAPLGWLVDFASSAMRDYQPRDGSPAREADCLTTEAASTTLVGESLASIREAAANGALLIHQDLVYILYRWRDFMNGDPTEVRTWTDSLMTDDDALVSLARAFTGQSWSTSMGYPGLPDRVSKSSTTAMIPNDIDILDSEKFRHALKRLCVSAELDSEAIDAVKRLLEAWDGSDRDDP